MEDDRSYVPPRYSPLGQSDLETEIVQIQNDDDGLHAPHHESPQWTSGICACFDDMQSCCVGFMCPCFVFGRNAEYLGSGTLVGPCMAHLILCGFVNALCCLLTDGIFLGMPGCFVACYASGYRKALRSKYNLPEAPCGDLTTHLFCHLCAVCQEYREIRERSGDRVSSYPELAEVAAPPIQTMKSSPGE